MASPTVRWFKPSGYVPEAEAMWWKEVENSHPGMTLSEQAVLQVMILRAFIPRKGTQNGTSRGHPEMQFPTTEKAACCDEFILIMTHQGDPAAGILACQGAFSSQVRSTQHQLCEERPLPLSLPSPSHPSAARRRDGEAGV